MTRVKLSHPIADALGPVTVWHVVDFEQVFDRAESLGAQFTERLNTRSFDILHVSIALELGCDTFHTFDRDQAKLASAVGLHTNRIS